MTKQLEAIRKTQKTITNLCAIMKQVQDGLQVKQPVSADYAVENRNVLMQRCFLDTYVDEVTILNMRFGENGEIPPHTHDQEEVLYILFGTLMNTITGEKYQQGTVVTIKPGKLHGLRSDNAAVVGVWRPPFEYRSDDLENLQPSGDEKGD